METEAILKDVPDNSHIDRIIRRRNKPARTRLSTTIDAEIHKKCVDLAEKEGVALSVVLDHLLNNALSIPGPKRMR